MAILCTEHSTFPVVHQDDRPLFRKSFLIKEKRDLVQGVELMMAQNKASCHQASSVIGVSQMYYIQFKKVIEKVDDLKSGDAFIP